LVHLTTPVLVVAIQCPNVSIKEKGYERKHEKGGKSKRAYIAW